MKYKFPLLLTGTIDTNVYGNVGNKITDITLRIKQYEKSIEKYIKNTPFDAIVFIENSNYSFPVKKFKDLALLYHKKFEFIVGTVVKDKVEKYGKSYGDAFLIHEALQKSAILNDCQFFYKITGRIFLKNSKNICKTCNKYRNEFIVYKGMGWCFTNIFKVNKNDYLKYFDDIYKECNESMLNDIEIAFYKRIIKADIKIGSFEVNPYFDGKKGATLQNYSGNFLERTIRNILAKLHVFSYSSKASAIFPIFMKIFKRSGYLDK